jgi:hypothetical protein
MSTKSRWAAGALGAVTLGEAVLIPRSDLRVYQT